MSGLNNDTTHAHAVYHHHEEGDQNTSSLSSGENDDDPDEAMDEEEINNTHNHDNRTLMVSRAVRAAAAADAVSLGDSSSYDSAQAKEQETLENSMMALDFVDKDGSRRHLGRSIDASHTPVSPLGASAYIVPFKLAAPQCPDDSDSSDDDQHHRNQVPSSPRISAEFHSQLPLHRVSSPHLARPPLVEIPPGPPRLLSLDQAGVIEGHSTAPLGVQELVVTKLQTNTTEFIPLNDSSRDQPRASVASSSGNYSSSKRESAISQNTTTSSKSFQIMKSLRRSHNWGDLEFRSSVVHSDTSGQQASQELKEDGMVYDSAPPPPRPPRRSFLGGHLGGHHHHQQGPAEPSKILQRMKEGISAGSNFFLSDYHASTLPRSHRHHAKPEDVLMEEKLKRTVISIGVFICFLLVVLSLTVLVLMVSNAK